MRILFSGNPAYGHLYPMLPLAWAARRRGHGTAFLTSTSMKDALTPFGILSAGPSIGELSNEYDRLHPYPQDGDSVIRPEDAGGALGGWVEFFARLRVDHALAEARDRIGRNRPDLIVAETADWVGPLVASDSAIPWARHAFGRPLPAGLEERMRRAALGRFPELPALTDRIAVLDPWPDWLHPPGTAWSDDRIVIRPDPPRGGFTGSPPDLGDREGRPTLLVTFGTVAHAPDALRRVLAAVTAVAEVAGLDVTVIVDRPPFDLETTDRLRVTTDVALPDLVAQASVVLSAGGPGTILQTLGQGRPLILLPLVMDQQQHAEAALTTGAAVLLEDADDAGRALLQVLGEPGFRRAAEAAGQAIARMSSPDQALDQLLALVP